MGAGVGPTRTARLGLAEG